MYNTSKARQITTKPSRSSLKSHPSRRKQQTRSNPRCSARSISSSIYSSHHLTSSDLQYPRHPQLFQHHSFHTSPSSTRHRSILATSTTKPTLSFTTASPSPHTSTSKRSMWFFPDDSIKSKVQRAIVNVFNLAPPPPSINVEEFALMSKMFKVIVDCRSEEQRQEGKIPKSVHVPLDTMVESNRDNLSIQFSQLTVLVYDQNGRTVDQAAAFLRDCGAESWSLEGGAESFKDFVSQTRDGTYTRRVTLEEARQHIHAQARAGARLPRPYDPNRVFEQFDTRLDEPSDFDAAATTVSIAPTTTASNVIDKSPHQPLPSQQFKKPLQHQQQVDI